MNLEELRTLQHNFFNNICAVYTKYKHQSLMSFLQEYLSHEQESVYIFDKSKPVLRCYIIPDGYRFIDEQEKIELIVNTQELQTLHNMLKNTGALKAHQKQNSILDDLLERFVTGDLQHIHEKPFLVYDIETTFTGSHISDQNFEMAYTIDSGEIENTSAAETASTTKKLPYKYVNADSAKRLCDFLLNYEGYIIGYNQIGFDNPVLSYNAWYGQAEIDILNKKSIDPFLFLRKLTGRRMSLNNVASALISAWKTLSSWKEWEQLLNTRKKTGDKRMLEKVKRYCKNDVQITLWVFLYLLQYSTIQVDNTTYEYTRQQLITLGSAASATQWGSSKSNGHHVHHKLF